MQNKNDREVEVKFYLTDSLLLREACKGRCSSSAAAYQRMEPAIRHTQ